MQIKIGRRSRYGALAVLLAGIVGLWLFRDAFVQTETQQASLAMLLGCIGLLLILTSSVALQITWEGKCHTIVHTVLFFIAPFLLFAMVECFNQVSVFHMSSAAFWRNYLWYLLWLGFVYALSGSVRVSFGVLTVLFATFAITNYCVMSFRGSPFLPWDIVALETGLSVASTYHLPVYAHFLMGCLLVLLCLVLSFKMQTIRLPLLWKILCRSVAGVLFAGMMLVFYNTDLFHNMGIEAYLWDQTQGYEKGGSAYNYWLNTKYLLVSKPDGYSLERVEEIQNKVMEEHSDPQAPAAEAPNLLVIMNETWSDLRVLGDYQTNQDELAFYHSLEENVVKGNLYVSTLGGGTSNTEFEFLTGNSMAFLPTSSNAYAQYISAPLPSLVTNLDQQGYHHSAFHPYYASGWKRDEIYPWLGFDRFTSMYDILDRDIVQQFAEEGYSLARLAELYGERYPEDPVFLRTFISDWYDYQQVFRQYEHRAGDAPIFLFNVTMQNHGGYGDSHPNFQEEIVLLDTEEEYPQAQRFLSLMKETDDALVDLLAYYEKEEDPTVILMFGDHQPNIEQGFLEEISGKPMDDWDEEEALKRYVTPFMIWANYDIEEGYVEQISTNYLSTLLMETAGVTMSPYQQFLHKLRQEVPVITAMGYYGADGNYYQNGDKSSPYAELLEEYQILQYYYLFEDEAVESEFFAPAKVA